jgi:hypothetical protein
VVGLGGDELAAHRLDDARVGVPDGDHVVVRVQVGVPVGVEEVDSLSAHQLDRLLIEEAVRGAE